MASETGDNLSAAMDHLGKLVGCFGLISGLAYICGWAQVYFFLGKFHALWALDFSSPQFLIQKGMPWMLLCCLISAILIGTVRRLINARGIGAMITVVPAAPIMMINVFVPSSAAFFATWVFPYLFLIYGAWILTTGLIAAQDKQPPQLVALMLLIALAWMVIAIPGIRANQEASDVRSGEVELASASSKDFTGMVLAVIGDKLLLQDCKSAKQLLIEPGGEWSISPNSLWCKESSPQAN